MEKEKLILGVLHIQVRCTECKGLCWTQKTKGFASEFYKCHTCTEPKLLGVGRPTE